MASVAGAGAPTCACAGRTNLPAPGWTTTLPAAIAAEPLSRSRLENRDLAMASSGLSPPPRDRAHSELAHSASRAGPACGRAERAGSHPEQLGVARLDLVALLLDRGGVLLHGLERSEWPPSVGLLGQRMQ